MAFFMGALTGLATSLDQGLKKNLADTDKKIETIALRESELRREERKELREQDKAIKDVLDGLSGFVDANKLPAGASAYDAAAAIFQNQAGGNLAEGQALISSLSESRRLGLDTDLVLDQVAASNLSAADIRRQFIDYPEQRAVPEAKGIGFLKGASLKDKISAAITEPEITGRPETEAAFGMAEVDLSKLAAAKEYADKQEMSELQKRQAELTLQKTEAEIAELGGLTEVAGRTWYNKKITDAVAAAGVPVNQLTGEFDLASVPEKVEKIKDAYTDTLKAAAKYWINTGTAKKLSGKNQLMGFAMGSPYVRVTQAPVTQDNKLQWDNMEVGKVYEYSFGGQPQTGIFLGANFVDGPFIAIPGGIR